MASHVDTAKTHQRRDRRGSWLACLPISPLGKVPGPLAESVIHDGIQSHFASPEQRLQMLEEREDEERLVVVAQSCEIKLLMAWLQHDGAYSCCVHQHFNFARDMKTDCFSHNFIFCVLFCKGCICAPEG